MVFATDFDPIDSSASRSKPSEASSANLANRSVSRSVDISPLHQTNRLIAQASHPQSVRQSAQQSAQQLAQQRRAKDFVANKVQMDGDDIAVIQRGGAAIALHALSSDLDSDFSESTSDPTVLAPLSLPVKPTLPLGLRILNRVQHGSTILTTMLITGALVLYGSSVYVDKSANRAMAELNHLQNESQQLTTANEAIKQSLAEQAAQENSGLEPYDSDDVLFVAPEPPRPSVDVEETTPERLKPLGY
ncbi:MAG: hypothetical protein ACFB16_14215 [Phormidesmis sp.]